MNVNGVHNREGEENVKKCCTDSGQVEKIEQRAFSFLWAVIGDQPQWAKQHLLTFTISTIKSDVLGSTPTFHTIFWAECETPTWTREMQVKRWSLSGSKKKKANMVFFSVEISGGGGGWWWDGGVGEVGVEMCRCQIRPQPVPRL